MGALSASVYCIYTPGCCDVWYAIASCPSPRPEWMPAVATDTDASSSSRGIWSSWPWPAQVDAMKESPVFLSSISVSIYSFFFCPIWHTRINRGARDKAFRRPAKFKSSWMKLPIFLDDHIYSRDYSCSSRRACYTGLLLSSLTWQPAAAIVSRTRRSFTQFYPFFFWHFIIFSFFFFFCHVYSCSTTAAPPAIHNLVPWIRFKVHKEREMRSNTFTL